jgi:small GTP-binding protein
MRRVRAAPETELSTQPPRIGVVGVSGTGKSSTINSMFKTTLPISHTAACTKNFESTPMELRMTSGVAKDESVKLTIVDAPGLGEDVTADPGYLEQYRDNLPTCDVVLWVLAARNRAVSLDQQYLQQLSDFSSKIVFGINQIDLVHPMDWSERINLPSEEMEANIAGIVHDRTERIQTITGAPVTVTAYSAQRGYNLEQLFTSIIGAIPETRKFIYDALKNFSFQDFIPVAARAVLDERN